MSVTKPSSAVNVGMAKQTVLSTQPGNLVNNVLLIWFFLEVQEISNQRVLRQVSVVKQMLQNSITFAAIKQVTLKINISVLRDEIRRQEVARYSRWVTAQK
jgi:hypothetical protein